MMFVDPWLARGQQSPIAFEQREFERTGYAVYVWRAIRICSELMLSSGTPVIDGYPEWVLRYLAVAADRVDSLHQRHAEGDLSNVQREVADILGFARPGKGNRTNAFDDLRKDWRDRALVAAVRRHIADHGVTPAAAFVELAIESEARREAYNRRVAAGDVLVPDPPAVVTERMYKRAWETNRD